jgi:hypothetical protein
MSTEHIFAHLTTGRKTWSNWISGVARPEGPNLSSLWFGPPTESRAESSSSSRRLMFPSPVLYRERGATNPRSTLPRPCAPAPRHNAPPPAALPLRRRVGRRAVWHAISSANRFVVVMAVVFLRSVATKMGATVVPRPSSLHHHLLFDLRVRRPCSSSSAPSGSTLSAANRVCIA